jgi:hypothetical protein
MSKTLSEEGMDLLFRAARTHNAWLDRPVLRAPTDLLRGSCSCARNKERQDCSRPCRPGTSRKLDRRP